MRKHCTFAGIVSPSMLTDPVALKTLKEYTNNGFAEQHELVKGAFHCIVDSGCSTLTTPYREDFECLGPLNKPVTLNGIAGSSVVTSGGIIKYECINTKGKIVTVRTFGYYNPHQNVRLFGSQAYFNLHNDKQGEFTI